MFRRPLLLLPAVLAAIALPVAPALAGEDDDDSGSASLRATQGCVSGDHARAATATTSRPRPGPTPQVASPGG